MCVGLDPDIAKLPEGLSKDVKGLADFCHGIIDAVADVASSVKPNLAFFEVHGWEGMKVFWDVCAHAKLKDLVVAADAKRNDIGNTATMYAEAYLGKDMPIDALTVNPYLGSDGIQPFIDVAAKNDKGIFVLVKTSNASSGELQDLPVGDEVLHEHLAQLCEGWGQDTLAPKSKFSCVGAVVGATYPEEMKYLRTLMPHAIFLIPGYGAQGASTEDVKHGFIGDGTGAIVNASRSIIYASKGKDWAAAARKAAETMADELHALFPSKK